EAFAAFLSDAARGGTGGEAPRLQHKDATLAGEACVEKGRRHARRLARPRRRPQYEIRLPAQRIRHLGQDRVDRQRLAGHDEEIPTDIAYTDRTVIIYFCSDSICSLRREDM